MDGMTPGHTKQHPEKKVIANDNNTIHVACNIKNNIFRKCDTDTLSNQDDFRHKMSSNR